MTATLHNSYDLGGTRLPNRLVMAPMTRNRAAEGGLPTPLMARYYAQRASAGLIVTEATQVAENGTGYVHTPGIHTDLQEAGWRMVTEAVHNSGGRVFLQIWHTGRVSHPLLQPGGDLPVAPSAINPEAMSFTPAGFKPTVTPRALTAEEIPRIVDQFARGAARARAAGFDGVEIHGANGYLIDQFIRDGANQRTDAYGGDASGRIRFAVAVARAAVDVWGPDKVGFRVSPRSTFNGMRDSDPAATFEALAAALNPLGLAYLHIVEPLPGHPAIALQEGVAPVAPMLRDVFEGTVIINGGYDRDTGNAAIAEGAADLVAYGVPFLANPDLPERFRQNAPLNAPDMDTFYGGDARGYTDYPALDPERQ